MMFEKQVNDFKSLQPHSPFLPQLKSIHQNLVRLTHSRGTKYPEDLDGWGGGTPFCAAAKQLTENSAGSIPPDA